jgi:hypothetical protein
MKISPVGAQFHADIRTGTHDKADRRVRNCANAPKKINI